MGLKITKARTFGIAGMTLSIIAIALLFIYFNLKKNKSDYSGSSQQVTITPTPQTDNKNKSSITIECINIKKIVDESSQEKISQIIEKEIRQIVAGYNLEEGAENTLSSGDSWLKIECIPVRSDDSIFSIKLDINLYGAGAAHPNHFVNIINYSVKSQRELKLKDLFAPGSDYLELLSKLSKTHLKEKFKGDYYSLTIKDGTSPEEVNFSNFLVDKKGLIMIFPPYQVAPHSEGTQQILILSTEMKPDYLY